MSYKVKVAVMAGVVAASSMIGGCSSNDDDDDGGGTDTTVAITVENAKEVASAAMTTVRLVGEFDLSSRISALIDAPDGSAMAQRRTTIPPMVIPCEASGTQTLSGEVADPLFNTLAAGDLIVFAFDSCEEFDGVTSTGTLNLSVQDFTGSGLTTPPFSYTTTVSATGLSLAEQGETRTLNGSATIVVSTNDGNVFTNNVAIDSLAYTEQESGDSGTLTNFTGTNGFDVGLSTYSQESSGSLSSQNIGGSVDFESTSIFRGVFSGAESNNPAEGVMEVTGAAGSKETISVLDSVNLQVEVDLEGDGTVEETIQTTWEELFDL